MGGRVDSFGKNGHVVQAFELAKQLALARALAENYAKNYPISDSNPDQRKHQQQQYMQKVIDELRAKAKIEAVASAEIAALVNGVPIPQARINVRVNIAIAEGNKDSSELRKAMQEKMINLELVAQEAIKFGLDKNDDVIVETELAEGAVLAEAFVLGYLKNHPISDAKPDQQERLKIQSIKNAVNALKAKAKIKRIASTETAALVNGVPISQAHINRHVKTKVEKDKVTDSPELRRAILEDLINIELMAQEAVRYSEADKSNIAKVGSAKGGKNNSVYAKNKNLQNDTKSQAQASHNPKWFQEPLSFMSIELGESLPKSVTECSGTPMVRPCYFRKEANENGEYEVTVIKIDLLNDTAWIKTLDGTFDGAVGNFKTTFSSGNFSQVEEMLIIKYGPPHKTKIEKLKTKGGAEFNNIVLLWLGEKVTIRAESFSKRLFLSGGMIYDIGEINVFTTEYLTKFSQESSNEAQKRAAGL